MIENCAHSAYRDVLFIWKTHRWAISGHDLRHCFDMHLNYLEHGAMLPELDLRIFESNQVWKQSNADLQFVGNG